MHKTSSAVFAVLALLLLLQDAEGLAGKIRAVNIPGIKDIAKFVTDKTVTFSIERDRLDTKRIRQSLPAGHEQSLGGQSDALGKEGVK